MNHFLTENSLLVAVSATSRSCQSLEKRRLYELWHWTAPSTSPAINAKTVVCCCHQSRKDADAIHWMTTSCAKAAMLNECRI